MVVLRLRSHSEAKDLLKKLKKMHKVLDKIVECVEEKYKDEDDDDLYDEDYRYDEEEEMRRRNPNSDSYRTRYRSRM